MNHKVWLGIFRFELILAGIFLFGQTLFKLQYRTDTGVALLAKAGLKWNTIHVLQLGAGISLVAIGIILIGLPRVKSFIRSNKITSYLIPMQIWLILALICMEVILRASIYRRPIFYIWSSWSGSIPAAGTTFRWEKEGYALTHYVSPGEIYTPFGGKNEIVLLGDSLLEGLQVADQRKFASVAETVLHKEGYDLDLHNLGRSGSTMADYVSFMPIYRKRFKPMVIVIQLTYTDFVESFKKNKLNYFVLENSKIVNVVHRYDPDGEVILNPVRSLNSKLMLSEFGQTRFDLMTNASAAEIDDDSAPGEFDEGLAAQQMELLIKKSRGIPIILVALPSMPTISNGQVVMEDPRHERLLNFLKNYPEIIVVDPLPKFQELTLTGFLPKGFMNSTVPGAGHLNNLGHKIVGELIAEAIKETLR